MRLHRTFAYAAAVGAALAMAGCWGDDDGDAGERVAPVPPPPVVVVPPPVVVVTEVPASAGVSTASLISFILALAMNNETSEPLTIGSTFAVPADETGEPTIP